jgi:methylphosphotriester-DNA--protein-cysteine methyltransferase
MGGQAGSPPTIPPDGSHRTSVRILTRHHRNVNRFQAPERRDAHRREGGELVDSHHHFRAVTSMTPIQSQKRIRLRGARTRLLAQPGDITGVGFAVGYDSPSQFSREYRRMFGEPPSRDALALRVAAALSTDGTDRTGANA